MKNCKIIDFIKRGDRKLGYLVALEENRNIPFDVKRVYYTYGVESGSIRGKHAHKELEQVLICVSGNLTVRCFDGEKFEEIDLDSESTGLYIGPMIWHEMYGYDKNTVLMVLASDYYNEEDYIRDYDKFNILCQEV